MSRISTPWGAAAWRRFGPALAPHYPEHSPTTPPGNCSPEELARFTPHPGERKSRREIVAELLSSPEW
jgi:hypothetical protein